MSVAEHVLISSVCTAPSAEAGAKLPGCSLGSVKEHAAEAEPPPSSRHRPGRVHARYLGPGFQH